MRWTERKEICNSSHGKGLKKEGIRAYEEMQVPAGEEDTLTSCNNNIGCPTRGALLLKSLERRLEGGY